MVAPSNILPSRVPSGRRLPFSLFTLHSSLFLLAFALRVPGLNTQPLWFDEGYSIYFSAVSPIETAQLTALDIHPPFYYWSLQLWTFLFGWHQVSVRFFSVWVGVLTVAALFSLGRRLGGRTVGLVAALGLTLSPLHVAYSQEVRMYALLALLAVVSTKFLSGRGRLATVGYGLTAGAALLTQYYAVFLIVGQWIPSLVTLVRGERNDRWLGLVIAAFPFACWMLFAFGSLFSYVRGKVAFEGYLPLDPVAFTSQITLAYAGAGPLAPVTAVVLVLLAATGLIRRSSDGLARFQLASVFGFSLAGAWLVNLISPFHPAGWERIVLFVLPFVLIAAALGVEGLGVGGWGSGVVGRGSGAGESDGWDGSVRSLTPPHSHTPGSAFRLPPSALIALAVYLGSAVPGLVQFHTRPVSDDPRPMIREVAALGEPKDLLLAVYPWQIGDFRLYSERPLPELRLIPASFWASDPVVLEQGVRQVGSTGRRIWFPAYQKLGRVLEDQLEIELARRLFPAQESWFGDHRLILYGAGTPDQTIIGGFRFGDLTLRDGLMGRTPADSIVSVQLEWAGQTTDLTGHLRLADEAGRTWAQHDRALVDSSSRHGILVPVGTPPGRYRVKLAVSDATGNRSVLGRNGEPLGTEAEIGQVTVELPPRPTIPQVIPASRLLNHDLGDGLRLVGASFGVGPYRSGDILQVSLFWIADQPQAARDATVRVGSTATTAAIGSAFPADRWPVGVTIREIRQVIFRPDGSVRSDGTADRAVTIEVGERRVSLGTVTFTGRTPILAPPATSITLGAMVGPAIELVGANVRSAGRTLPAGDLGRDLDIELVWRARAETDDDLAVFVHLVGPDGRPVAQHDSRPANGEAPTAGWSRGEVIIDRHPISVPASVPPGPYRIVVGLYRPPTGPRITPTGPGASGDTVLIVSGELR